MKKTIKAIDEKLGIIQVTTLDERWYAVPSTDPVTGVPVYEYYPSSSWISGYYPKGKGFELYLQKHGEEADQILVDAGIKGSHVHNAIEMIIHGVVIEAETPIYNGQTEKDEPLTTEEWVIVKTFVDWNNEVKPTYLLSERTVISKKHKYAGTLDCVAKIGDETYLIDFKTSKAIYPSHRIQVSSYKHALAEENEKAGNLKLAILQLGYALNKKHWKFTEFEDALPLFLHVYEIWREENGDAKPKQIDLPMKLSISNHLKPKDYVEGKKDGEASEPAPKEPDSTGSENKVSGRVSAGDGNGLSRSNAGSNRGKGGPKKSVAK